MKKISATILLALFATCSYSQGVGIGTTPNPSAMLDVSSTSRGLLAPRVALTGSTDATTITNGNVTSLLVYNTATVADVIPGYYYWNGTAWTALENTDEQDLSYDPATNILSLTNDGTSVTLTGLIDHDWHRVGSSVPPSNINDNIFTQGNVGIATTSPTTRLQVGPSPGGTYRAWMDYGVLMGNDSDGIYIGLKDEGSDREDAIIAWGDNSQDNLRFMYNQSGLTTSAEVMTLQPDGDVGLGEVNPTNKLAIGANLGVGYGISLNSGTPYGQLIETRETTASNNAAFWVRTNTGSAVSQLFRVQNNGNVGLGTITPSTGTTGQGGTTFGTNVLEVNSPTRAVVSIRTNSSNSLATLSLSANNAASRDLHINHTADGHTYFTHYTGGSQANQFWFMNDGALGIGTNTPAHKLDVVGGAILRATNASYFWSERNDADFNIIQAAGSAKRSFAIHPATTGANVLDVYANNGGTFVAGLTVENTTGDVGVGTFNPTSKLTVNGVLEINKIADVSTIYFTNSFSEPGYIRHSGNNNNAEMRFVASDDFDAGSAGDKFTFGGETGGVFTEAMRIQGNGNVGIKTTAPSQRLHVIGNILASGALMSSDKRYKKNIQNLKNSTDLIASIRPVAYNFRTEEFPEGQFDDNLHYGVISQELELVLPNLVYTDLEGYKSVNYTELIPLLIKSNQEQQSLIEEQQKQINQLIDAVKALKK